DAVAVRDRVIVRFESGDSPFPFASDFSPDGRLITYAISEDATARGLARTTIYVEPYPRSNRVDMVGVRGRGFHPTWLPDGRGLSYSIGVSPEGPQWVIAGVTTQPNFAVLNPTPEPNGGLVRRTPEPLACTQRT